MTEIQYIAVLESEKKQLEKMLSEQCPDLKQSLDWANKRENELLEQIEKMKCCYNCKHTRTEYEHCRTDKHEKWELKE